MRKGRAERFPKIFKTYHSEMRAPGPSTCIMLKNPPAMFWKRIRLTLEMIKFEHSVFALPFALTGALLAIRDGGLEGQLLWGKIGWIVLAMVGARSAAMAFNRLVDSDVDARNPRT